MVVVVGGGGGRQGGRGVLFEIGWEGAGGGLGSQISTFLWTLGWRVGEREEHLLPILGMCQ